ncbi:PhzF family phenazine biosynthesis protein [Shimia sp. MMG029]|uniref:PhzF family phenazine biosynthesis protein n=1 Tax=Shimia sp. MMG029 TaxID=3021978 RepID=UPI0022FDFDD4|nr:PhzF family phenazine biosynthesis protein [Shimia sp. MMG029]MDA5557129.1 PhzF family phenazine biosynthesis protein [Shimia sp. MMG029]
MQPAQFPFTQVDVFTDSPSYGNPLAVVSDAAALSPTQMAQLAHWTNLSETSFLLPPSEPSADYRVRIFTPLQELPFAGHPTLGSAQVWLNQGGVPKGRDIVQECGAGLIRICREGDHLFFRAPPLTRSGALDADTRTRAIKGLGLTDTDILDAAWVDNGPGWAALLLQDRATAMAITPDYSMLNGLRIGVVAPAQDTDFEVRAFSAGGFEDPVTGSLNAGIAQWLIAAGHAAPNYIAAQGTALGRKGRVHVQSDGAEIWVGGAVQSCVEGTIRL